MTTKPDHPFSPPLDAEPGRPARIGILVVVAFVLVLGAWSALAPVSGAAIANGSLQVEGRRQSVQHPYGGVVERLAVREGQMVERGDILLTLSDAEPAARLEILETERDALKAAEGRLLAERDGEDALLFDAELTARADEPGVAQALANERAVMEARSSQFEAERDMLTRKVSQLREVASGARSQIEGLERRSALLEEEIEGARTLLASGHTPRARVRELEGEAATIESERGSRMAEAARAEEAIGEAETEIARAERARLSEITDELRATQAKLLETGPRIVAARDVLARTDVVAPATGAVVDLSAFTEGGVVEAGARILDIVPSDSALIVEARLHLSDVQDVRPGRSARVHLVGINRADRPDISGEVMTVSADRLTDERTGEGYYSVRVAMDPEDVRAAGMPLQAGMPAELVMTTRARTFIEYIVSPLTDEVTRAFRED